MRNQWTRGQVLDLGVRTDLVTAGSVLGLSRPTTYELAKKGEFPVPVLRMGRKYVVPVAGLLAALGIDAAA